MKFTPVYKAKIWGGSKFKTILGKEDAPENNCGESWEISCIEDNCSVVSNGFLQGSSLQEIIDIYMDDLVGENVYEKYEGVFPLLIKFLDINDLLSIQVHPGNDVAMERHGSLGKTEMWYIIDAEPGSRLIVGFKDTISRDEFIEGVLTGSLPDLLNNQVARKDEAYFIPAGRIHSSGKGLLIAEIQQSSDITYRISDWNRLDDEGKPRELNVDMSLDVLDYTAAKDYRSTYTSKLNETVKINSCEFFTVNILEINKIIEKEFGHLGSFLVYMCIDGSVTVRSSAEDVVVNKGETVLIPACLGKITLHPDVKAKILEVYV